MSLCEGQTATCVSEEKLAVAHHTSFKNYTAHIINMKIVVGVVEADAGFVPCPSLGFFSQAKILQSSLNKLFI